MLHRRLASATRTLTRPPLAPLRHHPLGYASSAKPPPPPPKPHSPTPETPTRKTIRYLTQPFSAPPVLARFPLLHATVRYLTYAVVLLLSGHIFFEYGYTWSEGYGISMLPTIASTGEQLIISKYYRRGREISVGDVISFKHPVREGERAVKRVLGMPGDFVLRDTPTSSSGVMVQVPTGHCWVVGDNLSWSRDSRLYGPLPLALVTGKVVATFKWFEDFKFVKHGLQPAGGDEDEEGE